MTAAGVGRLWERAAARCIAGSPARQRGNFGFAETFGFHLLRQKKVTKEEALNRTRAPQARVTQGNNRMVIGKTRPAALSRLSLSPTPTIAASVRLTRGCTPCSREKPNTASLGRRDGGGFPMGRRPSDAVFPGEFGVQPTLTGVKVRALVLVIGTAARAKRVASARDTSGRFRAIAFAQHRSCAVQRLSFGDFSLAQQRKVTRPPGRTPGNHTGQQTRAVSP